MPEIKLTIKDKTYIAPKPKGKQWREWLKIRENNKLIDTEEGFDDVLKLIASHFDNSEVTPEIIENYVDLTDIWELHRKVIESIVGTIERKRSELPKNQKTTDLS